MNRELKNSVRSTSRTAKIAAKKLVGENTSAATKSLAESTLVNRKKSVVLSRTR